MIVDEFRDSIAIYNEMLLERHDPFDMLNIVDKRLADISNHIAICHRVLAEQRSLAHMAFLPSTRKKHLDKAEASGKILDQVIAIQSDLFEFRYKVLRVLAEVVGLRLETLARNG